MGPFCKVMRLAITTLDKAERRPTSGVIWANERVEHQKLINALFLRTLVFQIKHCVLVRYN